ncbi:hypothetical protein Cni_G03706 [Canna indica]|uniref:CREG-like beta-barrel domain-containing protein n=1 Tax=Canna indica TaxID=4628 RepID=A0AAQ3JS31_9LILI|nr:hypothetical protein Cni_G03706 [Canna indica]
MACLCCSSNILSGRIEASPCRLPTSSFLVKAPTLRVCWNGGRENIVSGSMLPSHRRCGRRWQVTAQESSGGIGENNVAPSIGLTVSISNSSASSEIVSVQNSVYKSSFSEKLEIVSPIAVGSGVVASKPGLFRMPISSGVQSATYTHGLPPPALAVRNLMEQATFGQLCTVTSEMHHHRAGYPVGSLVDFSPDSMGHPIFSLSPLAIHTRNLLSNPKCSLVVQIPGWSSLSNARVTIFGDVFPLAADLQDWAHQQFVSKQQQRASQKWGNFHYYRMQNISDIYFVGGFGTVEWVDVKEYEGLKPDKIAAESGEENLKELNAIFSKRIKDVLSTEAEIDDAVFVSVDSKGTDVRVREGAQFNIQRISFGKENDVLTLDEAKAALEKIINRSIRSKPTKGN